jgi:hypothetical protein
MIFENNNIEFSTTIQLWLTYLGELMALDIMKS